MDLRPAVLPLQDFSNGNDVIGVGADDNSIHRGALRRDLSSTARSDHVDAAQGTQGTSVTAIRHHVPHRYRPLQFEACPKTPNTSLAPVFCRWLCDRPGYYLPITVYYTSLANNSTYILHLSAYRHKRVFEDSIMDV